MKKSILLLTLFFCAHTLLYAESYSINVGESKVINCTASIPYSDNGVIHANFKLVDSNNATYLSVSQTGSTWCTVYGYYPKDDMQIKVTCSYTVGYVAKEYYYYIYVSVKGINPTSLSMNQSQYSMYVKETKQVSVQVSPANANTYCRWSIESDYGNPSNFEIYQSNSGLNNEVSIYAKSAGKCRVLVKTLNNLTASCIVEALDINATSITLNYSSLTLQKGDSYKIKASLTPSNATSEVTWKSSNSSVAKVSNGTITAVATGSATITASTSNGISKTCAITVIPQALEYEYQSSTNTAKVINCDNDMLTNGSITIPATTKNGNKSYSVTTIGEYAFQCSNLRSVIIASGIKTIENHAFYECYNLENIEVPNSITEIGEDIFYEYCELSKPVYNSTLFIFMPSNVTYSKYIIPNGIKEICFGAFASNTSIKTITIPETVTNIADKAFNGSRVNHVICQAYTPPYCTDYSYSSIYKEFRECFSSTQYNGILTVPNGRASIYCSSEVWSNFVTINEGTGATSDLPPDGSTLSCSEAANYASQLQHNTPTAETYTIYGYITETDGIVSRNQQIFWMADTKNGGNVFQIYWGNVTEQLKVGDYIKCTGHLMRYNEKNQMKNPTVTLMKRDQSDTPNLPPDGSILTCSNAAYYASLLNHNTPTAETYTIYGYITETDGIVSRNQQIFWMADTQHGGKVFEIYWGNVSEQLLVGDYVKCQGHLMRFYETSEMKNPNVTLISRMQGFDDVETENTHCTKILLNGLILIQKGDKTYTVTGIEVR